MAIPIINATVGGTLSAPANVAATEKINGNLAGTGAKVRVTNGSGGSINVGFTDPGKTRAGNTGTQAPTALAAAASKYYPLSPAYVDAAGEITMTFSGTTSVTAEIITAT